MSKNPLLGLCIVLVLVLICNAAYIACNGSNEPHIIINLPKDAKPLATLTQPGDKVVGSDRAVLWYTVWKASLDKGWNQSAIDAANAAIDKVYGPLPTHP